VARRRVIDRPEQRIGRRGRGSKKRGGLRGAVKRWRPGSLPGSSPGIPPGRGPRGPSSASDPTGGAPRADSTKLPRHQAPCPMALGSIWSLSIPQRPVSNQPPVVHSPAAWPTRLRTGSGDNGRAGRRQPSPAGSPTRDSLDPHYSSFAGSSFERSIAPK